MLSGSSGRALAVSGSAPSVAGVSLSVPAGTCAGGGGAALSAVAGCLAGGGGGGPGLPCPEAGGAGGLDPPTTLGGGGGPFVPGGGFAPRTDGAAGGFDAGGGGGGGGETLPPVAPVAGGMGGLLAPVDGGGGGGAPCSDGAGGGGVSPLAGACPLRLIFRRPDPRGTSAGFTSKGLSASSEASGTSYLSLDCGGAGGASAPGGTVGGVSWDPDGDRASAPESAVGGGGGTEESRVLFDDHGTFVNLSNSDGSNAGGSGDSLAGLSGD